MIRRTKASKHHLYFIGLQLQQRGTTVARQAEVQATTYDAEGVSFDSAAETENTKTQKTQSDVTREGAEGGER